jgi:hypothetical protein
MSGQEIDPLPRAFDPERCPDLLGMEEPFPFLPVQAFDFVGARRGVAFEALHLDPLGRRLVDGPGQAFSFFPIYCCLPCCRN